MHNQYHTHSTYSTGSEPGRNADDDFLPPFEFSLNGFSRWHAAVYYLLGKGKSPVLSKLHTIKLLEGDFNFGLKWALSWRFGNFAEKHGSITSPNMLCQKIGAIHRR